MMNNFYVMNILKKIKYLFKKNNENNINKPNIDMKIIEMGNVIKCHCPHCGAFLEINNDDWNLKRNSALTNVVCPCCDNLIYKEKVLEQIEERINDGYN